MSVRVIRHAWRVAGVAFLLLGMVVAFTSNSVRAEGESAPNALPAGCVVVPLPTGQPGGLNCTANGIPTGRSTWPIPTTPESLPGLYEGGGYHAWGTYRSELRCMMVSGDEVEPGATQSNLYCRQCRETLIGHTLLKTAHVYEQYPADSVVDYGSLGAFVNFEVKTRSFPVGPSYEYVWSIDGVEISGANSSLYALDTSSLTGTHLLRVVVRDSTDWAKENNQYLISSYTSVSKWPIGDLLSQSTEWTLVP